MSQTINLKKGFDLNILGKAEHKTLSSEPSETYALKPTDFHGLEQPKLLVKVGDTVKAGSPLLYDKSQEDVKFVSPVSGEVVEINRGAKRKLLEIKVLGDKDVEFEKFDSFSISDISNLDKEKVVQHMAQSGVWANIIERPYGVVAQISSTPKSIFVSAFDSSPLAPDEDITLKGREADLKAGFEILKKLTAGTVHLNVSSDKETSGLFSGIEGIQINKFSGPHPSGNVGTQIHHIDPINKGEIVWTLTPYGVAQIGKLFLEGIYDASKVIALTGSSLKETGYVNTYSGAAIKKLVADRANGENLRYVSGNLLTGESIGIDGHLGFAASQLTVIPEGDEEEFLGWILPSTNKLSFHRSFGLLNFLNGKKEYEVTTNTQGEKRGFVMTGAFEQVMPMDVLPTYLFKSIIANDYDEMEALGIYELIEEDVALCEFIDVSKNDLQELLREGIELIRNS